MAHHHHDDVERHHEVREYHVVERDSGAGVGMVLGVILALILAVVLLWFLFAGNLFTAGPGASNPSQPAQGPSIDINVGGGSQPSGEAQPGGSQPSGEAPSGGTGGDTNAGTGTR